MYLEFPVAIASDHGMKAPCESDRFQSTPVLEINRCFSHRQVISEDDKY